MTEVFHANAALSEVTARSISDSSFRLSSFGYAQYDKAAQLLHDQFHTHPSAFANEIYRINSRCKSAEINFNGVCTFCIPR